MKDQRHSRCINDNMKRTPLFFLSAFCLSAGLFPLTVASAQSPDRHPLYEPVFSKSSASAAGNLFLNAGATASGTYDRFKPELAVDGKYNDGESYWCSEYLPVWHQVDMGKEQKLSSLKIWPYWTDGRIYKYKIEGSRDGQNWETLVDQSANSITGTSDGFSFAFPAKEVRYVRTTILENSKGAQNGGHIVEIQGFAEEPSAQIMGQAASTDVRFSRDGVPAKDHLQESVAASAWRGERVNGQIVLWGDKNFSQVRLVASPLTGPKGKTIPMQANFIRYSKGGNALIADIIDDVDRLDLPGGTSRPAWVTVDVPRTAEPGVYKGTVTAVALGGSKVSVPVQIEVLSAEIPSPENWKVHLDIWQHPEAVARWHGVKPWSKEHFALMKPLMKRLADAGQKTVSCSLIDEAWNEQTYDWWPAMIEWVRKPDGTMTYDYTNFDKWVKFMMDEVGIKGHLSCYTMVPWSLKLRYLDQATGEYRNYELKPGEKSFEEIWGPFLTDFRKHVKSKGWLDKTCIALDERPDHMVKAAKQVLDKYAPDLEIVSAVNAPSNLTRDVYDISPQIGHAETVFGDLLKERKAAGKKTTFYVCCAPAKPNTFTNSPLAESEWLGLFAAANNLDGFLRWAYNSWNRNPFESTDFGTWPTGDAFLVYPGDKSSLRFERLRDGLENFEKVEVLRGLAAKQNASPALKKAVADMDKELKELFTVKKSHGNEHADDVRKANEAILRAARAK